MYSPNIWSPAHRLTISILKKWIHFRANNAKKYFLRFPQMSIKVRKVWIHKILKKVFTASISELHLNLFVLFCIKLDIACITDYGHPWWRHKSEIWDIWKIGPMWQTKYASAVPKNLGVGVNFRPFSESYFLSVSPWLVS